MMIRNYNINIYGRLMCVHMYVCSCKYASIKLRPHWFLGMGVGETISKQLFKEMCKLSLPRKTWLRELASYQLWLPGLVNAPTNKWTSCCTYTGMGMGVCVCPCTHIGQRQKSRKIPGLEGC